MAEEWIEGFGTMAISEPTTVCDVARTFSYITSETPAVKEVEKFLREVGYVDGTYDEDGRWRPPCSLRIGTRHLWRLPPRGEGNIGC